MSDKRMYTRAPLENIWGGFMRSVISAHYLSHEAKMEDMLAKARALCVSEDKVRELVAAERKRAESSPRPFSWDTISDQITRAAL